MSAALQSWGQMMLKKYLPEMLVVLLITILSFALWTQTNRLNAAKNQTKAMQLAFDQYKVDQQAQHQKDKEAIQAKHQQELQNEKQRAQTITTQRDNALTERDGLLAETARLRSDRNTPPTDGCKAAINTIRVLTELLEETDRLAGVYAQYADQNKNALLSCNGFYQGLKN